MRLIAKANALILLGTCCLLIAAVPPAAAITLDLTTPDASGWIGVAFFLEISPQSTGSGVIEPFVRIQASGDEQGFNTDYRPLTGDLEDVDNSPFTHSVVVASLESTVVDGEPTVPFLLDINQEGSMPLLSLDELRVYTAPTPDISDLAGLGATNLIYDMGIGNKIYLDFSLNNGSGSGDMFFFLPSSLFDGLGTQFMYLYSKFGATGGDYASNDGYEEWAQIRGVPVANEDRTWGAVKSLYR